MYFYGSSSGSRGNLSSGLSIDYLLEFPCIGFFPTSVGWNLVLSSSRRVVLFDIFPFSRCGLFVTVCGGKAVVLHITFPVYTGYPPSGGAYFANVFVSIEGTVTESTPVRSTAVDSVSLVP